MFLFIQQIGKESHNMKNKHKIGEMSNLCMHYILKGIQYIFNVVYLQEIFDLHKLYTIMCLSLS